MDLSENLSWLVFYGTQKLYKVDHWFVHMEPVGDGQTSFVRVITLYLTTTCGNAQEVCCKIGTALRFEARA